MRGLLLVVALLLLGCSGAATPPVVDPLDAEPPATAEAEAAPDDAETLRSGDPAPPFPTDLAWLNTDRPLTLEQLRGKVVLLDFWTYGCINCMHIIPDLKRLEEKYAEELVVIGVHSAKFENEAQNENIRQIILRYGIEHPVINDANFEIWNRYGVRAWPTLILIDPAGDLVGGDSGEGIYEPFDGAIGELVSAFDARGQLDREPLALKLEREGLPQTVLSFPGKVATDPEGERLFIADSNNHRIIVASTSGEVQQVIGTGEAGYADGAAESVRFRQPQGMAFDAEENLLYVADTGNHSIRRVDLESSAVETLAGTGEQSDRYPGVSGVRWEAQLNSPWDVALAGESLYIAMAGSHQIWELDLLTERAEPFAGSSFEALTDGPTREAAFNQPSGLALSPEISSLFVADAEASAIREVTLGEREEVTTIVGTGLFDFGDRDGVGPLVRLQHPLGIVWHEGALLVADTYNHKIKRIDPTKREAVTLLGDGSGWRDGAEPLFYEPSGLALAGKRLFVADTNNNSIRVVDLETMETETLTITGVDPFLPSADDERFSGEVVELPAQQLRPGVGEVVLDVTLPPGYKVNDLAPFQMSWAQEGDAVTFTEEAEQSIRAPSFPLRLPARFEEGQATLLGDLTIYYCEVEQQLICLFQQVQLRAAVEVNSTGTSTLTLDYALPVAEPGD